MEERDEVEQHASISRSSSSDSDEGVILDKSSYEAVKEEVGDVRAMLLKLRRVLQEVRTLAPPHVAPQHHNCNWLSTHCQS